MAASAAEIGQLNPTYEYELPLLERVESLRDVILDGGNRAQELRRLPDDTVDTLIDHGFFRFALPTELGGENASVLETIEVLEAMCAIDASVGWNVMIGSEINAMGAGGMPPDLAKEVYIDNPRVIMCGGGGPGSTMPRAEPQEDGSYRVWSQTSFMSGCNQAEWCFQMAPVVEKGEVRMNPDGTPFAKMWFIHRSEWEIVDTWNMAGLRGSGSHDVKSDGALVPGKFADVDLIMRARYNNPTYRIPVALRLSYNKVAVALGVARGALDAFSDLAQNKIPLMSTGKLRERPVAQHRMGEAEAMVRSSRAFVMEAMGAVVDELERGAEKPGPETTKIARLACLHATNVCMQAVDLIHNTAGTTGMRMDSPLERKLRDAHGCATHRWVSHPLYADLGRIFLGFEPSPEMAGD